MAKYTSKPTIVNRPVAELYDRISDISSFKNRINELPEEQRSKMGDIEFAEDSIKIKTAQVGELKFVVSERVQNTRIVFSAQGSPIPLGLVISFKELEENTTELTASIDIEIPAMLRPLIGGKMQEAADKFGEMFTQFN